MRMQQKTCFKVGEKAPDFSLPDQNKKVFRLSDLKEKRILLSFHPLAWTPLCAEQMKSLEKHWKEFRKLNTIAIGINVDPVPSKKAWAGNLGIKYTRLLSDFWPHGHIAKKYGLFRKNEGFSERANIIINRDHRIEFVRVYDLADLPDINELFTFLREFE